MMKNEKGIKFDICSEEEAEKYLLYHNNYMRTACYRKNYPIAPCGKNIGKYINLDFAYLQELSRIDLELRYLVSKMCLDIEHNLKVSMLKDIERNSLEDGYTIVFDFLKKNKYVIENIARNSRSSYTQDLIKKYFDITTKDNKNIITSYSNCPIWVILELISFGDFIKCYEDYYIKYSNINNINRKTLNSITSLRNSCAHNNCILQNLKTNTAKPQQHISNVVSKITTITTTQMNKKLTSRPILELTILFYVHSSTVLKETKDKRVIEINKLFLERCYEKHYYFKDNELIVSNFKFICSIIEHFYNN